MNQLKMIFLTDSTPMPELKIAEGFRMRTIADHELAKYNELRVSVEFPAWEESYLKDVYRKKVLPDGLYLIEEIATGRFAASAGAETTDMPEHPEVGVLGWVMAHPEMRGYSLGKAASVAVMHRLAEEGYRAFSLLTDDFRIAALKTYLDLGWRPWLYQEDMEARWRTVADQLGRDFESLGALPADFIFPAKG